MTERGAPGRRRRIEGFLLRGKKQRQPVSSGTHLQLVCTAAKCRREHNGEEGEKHDLTRRWDGQGPRENTSEGGLQEVGVRPL